MGGKVLAVVGIVSRPSMSAAARRLEIQITALPLRRKYPILCRMENNGGGTDRQRRFDGKTPFYPRKATFEQKQFAYRVASGDTVASAEAATGVGLEQSRELCVDAVIRRVNNAAVERLFESDVVAKRAALIGVVWQMVEGAYADFAELVGLPWDTFCKKLNGHKYRAVVKNAVRRVDRDTGEAYCASIELHDRTAALKLMLDVLSWGGGPMDGDDGKVQNVIVLPAQEKVVAPPDDESAAGGGADGGKP